MYDKNYVHDPEHQNSMVYSSTDGITWTPMLIQISASFLPRFGHTVVEHNNALYLIGGKVDVSNISKTTFQHHSESVDDTYLSDVWSSVDGLNWQLN